MWSLCAAGTFMKVVRGCDYTYDTAYSFYVEETSKKLYNAKFKEGCKDTGCKCTTDFCNHASYMTSRSLALAIAAVTSFIIY